MGGEGGGHKKTCMTILIDSDDLSIDRILMSNIPDCIYVWYGTIYHHIFFDF